MNKRFLAVALSMLLVFGAGCTGNALSGNKDDNQSNAQIVQSNPQPDAPDTIETIQNPDEGENVSSENTENEKTLLPPMETEFHAEYDGWIYYRQYNTEDLTNPIFPYFGTLYSYNDSGKTRPIYRMDKDGNTEVYFKEDTGFGRICISDAKLFSQEFVDNGSVGATEVYYHDLKTGDIYGLPEYKTVLGSYGDYVFAQRSPSEEEYYYGTVSLIDATIFDEVAMVDGQYLGADADGVYTYEVTGDYETQEYELTVSKLSYNGSTKVLCKLDNSYFEDWEMGWDKPEITCFQTVDDTVYMNVGLYGGTGHFYQYGFVVVAFKNTDNFYKVCDTENDTFYCMKTPESVDVIVNEWDEENQKKSVSYNVAGKLTQLEEYIGEECGKPYIYYSLSDSNDRPFNNGDVIIYPDASGKLETILEYDDYGQFGLAYGQVGDDYDTADMCDLCNIEYVGNKLFFTYVEMERNPKEDVGWRMAYKHKRTMDFVKDLETGEVTLLFEY